MTICAPYDPKGRSIDEWPLQTFRSDRRSRGSDHLQSSRIRRRTAGEVASAPGHLRRADTDWQIASNLNSQVVAIRGWRANSENRPFPAIQLRINRAIGGSAVLSALCDFRATQPVVIVQAAPETNSTGRKRTFWEQRIN